MKKCYTISSIQSIPDGMDRIQFTENRRIFPTSRRTTEHLAKYRSAEKGSRLPIMIHWDFIYIVSRYAMMSDKIRKACVDHMVQLLNYADNDGSIDGIVMHTDWPIQKIVTASDDPNAAIDTLYKSGMWNTERVKQLVNAPLDPVTQGILEFYDDVMAKLGRIPNTKIMLECTTKIGPNLEGSSTYIISLLTAIPELKNLYGWCYDTEHTFAGTGEWYTPDDLKAIKETSGIQVCVHVNAIPEGVTARSRKDRHSETTIEECSVHNSSFYRTFTETLDELDIPWVRELHEDTTNRELEILNK